MQHSKKLIFLMSERFEPFRSNLNKSKWDKYHQRRIWFKL